jgi:hypothetical protein
MIKKTTENRAQTLTSMKTLILILITAVVALSAQAVPLTILLEQERQTHRARASRVPERQRQASARPRNFHSGLPIRTGVSRRGARAAPARGSKPETAHRVADCFGEAPTEPALTMSDSFVHLHL